MKASKPPLHVLVYRLSALGDVAMTIPAIYSCASRWSGTTFHVVTDRFCAQLFADAPTNVEIVPADKSAGTWQMLMLLNKMETDAVADLHNVLRSWIIDAWFLLKGKRVCILHKNRSERRAIMRHGKHTPTPFVHRYFDVFRRLGLDCEPRFTSLFKTLPPLPVDTDKGQERWIGIAPFARYANKMYPLEKMKEVVRMLAEQPGYRLFLFGSKGLQADSLSEWGKLSPRVCTVAGRFTLKEELSLMARLDVMLSMDSANQHMASLVGTRVISVWGSTTPACGFMGWNQRTEDAVCRNISCQPCSIGGSTSCRMHTLACLNEISPQVIVNRITETI